MERDAPLAPLTPLTLPPTPLPAEAGPNSSDMVHTKIRRQHPNSKPEILKTKTSIDCSGDSLNVIKNVVADAENDKTRPDTEKVHMNLA